jgi:multidrug efflux pump subunit AcrB
MDRQYGRMLNWSLAHQGIFVIGCLCFFATIFPLNARIGRDWIPPDDRERTHQSRLICLKAPRWR